MHILEIPSFFTPYGGEFCLEQAKALKALGNEVRILSNVQLGITIGGKDFMVFPSCRFWQERDGVEVYQTYQRGVPKMLRHNVTNWIKIVRSMFEDYIGKHGKPDILHAHCAKWAGYAAMLISRQYGIPYVITEHLSKMLLEREFGKAPSTAWQIPLLKEAYENANMVIPVSEELVDDVACYYGKNYKYTPVSNMIDVDFFAYRERQKGVNDSFSLACIANAEYRKGYDVLLPAFSKLLESGVKAELHIAGRGTDSRSFRKKLPEGVISHGLIDKHAVRNLLYRSHALVLASRSETQGLVLLEAMSTGIPAISTEAIPKSIRIDCGFNYVPIGDVDALATEMLKAANTPNINGRELSEKVRERVSGNAIAFKLIDIFQRIV